MIAIKQTIVVGFGLSLLLAPIASMAQERSESIYAPCSVILNDAERLLCFDKTYQQEIAIDEQRAQDRRDVEIKNFGLNSKQVRLQEQEKSSASAQQEIVYQNASANADDELRVRAMITEVLTDALGNNVLILDNGQIWRSTSNKSFKGRVKTGWPVEISKIWSGGYRLTIKDKTGFLGVARVR